MPTNPSLFSYSSFNATLLQCFYAPKELTSVTRPPIDFYHWGKVSVIPKKEKEKKSENVASHPSP